MIGIILTILLTKDSTVGEQMFKVTEVSIIITLIFKDQDENTHDCIVNEYVSADNPQPGIDVEDNAKSYIGDQYGYHNGTWYHDKHTHDLYYDVHLHNEPNGGGKYQQTPSPDGSGDPDYSIYQYDHGDSQHTPTYYQQQQYPDCSPHIHYNQSNNTGIKCHSNYDHN